MPVAALRIAICRRCRSDERRAAGAAGEDELLECAKEAARRDAIAMHCRISQCLNCCDGGHTVRIEREGVEVAVVGIRSREEIERVVREADSASRGAPSSWMERRTWQIWTDGRMTWHRHRDEG